MIDIFKSYNIPPRTTGHLKIGPLALWMANLPNEWRISWSHSEDPIHETVQDLMIEDSPSDSSGFGLHRFGFTDKSDSLIISARLSDRSMVVRPDNPLLVPGGEKITFVLSTPLWLRIHDGGRGCFLTEIPTHRPSDTWFGDSPVEGELCYSTRTAARLRIEELPTRHHRAITMVAINNLDRKPLLIDRIKIPMRNLSLYRGEAGWFYTDNLSYDWEGEKDEIKMNLRGKPDLPGHRLVQSSGPRDPLESNLVIRTVRSFLRS